MGRAITNRVPPAAAVDAPRPSGSSSLHAPRADLVVGLVLLGSLVVCSLYSTSLFHLAAGIAVALAAFGILSLTISLRRIVEVDAYPEFLGIALAFTALLYILRGLTFAHWNAPLGGQGNLTSQFSLAAQFLSSTSLLVAPLFIARRSRPALLVAVYGLVTGLLIATIVWWHLFPVCRLPNGDLTTFKQAGEGACCAALLVAIPFTWHKRGALDPTTLRLMVAALHCAAISALLLTVQARFAEPLDVVAHLLLVGAVCLIYAAVAWSGVRRPTALTLAELRQRSETAEWQYRRALKDLRVSEHYRRTLLSESPLGVVVIDRDLTVSECNEAAVEILGIAQGSPLALDPATDGELLRAVRSALQGTPAAYEGRHRGPVSERESWISGRASPLVGRNGKVSGAILVITDASQHKHAEELIERLAFHDALTDLPNRTLLRDRLRQALDSAQRRGRLVAVAVVDLDRFKAVNDSLGQSSADTVLQQVATRLSEVVRKADTVARSGGDEFAVLMAELRRPQEAAAIAEKILAALRQPWEVGGEALQMTASAGLAFYPNDAPDAQGLLENAHSAMRAAKELGRDTFQFYDLAFARQTAERIALERELRLALEEKQLLVYYQPQVDLGDGQIVGFEALVRWQHPERGLVPPDQFIGLAEETGLIEALDLFVVAKAARQVADWQALIGRHFRLAVNVSAKRLQGPHLLSSIADVLRESGLAPAQLEVELTETAILADAAVALRVLTTLREMGLTVALDDFGTGYSSLAHLQQLPITTVKIDRSFVAKVSEDTNAATIVSAIAHLGCDLGLRVVAEGVETAAQLDFVRRAGCHEVQGYLLAKPLPAADCEALLVAGGRLGLAL